MSGGPFPLFLDDLRASTLGWPAEDRWAYLCLLHAMWKNGGFIADDPKAIREASDLLATPKWKAKVAVLRAKCDGEQREINGASVAVLTHRRIRAEMEKAQRIRDARAAAGAKGGQAKATANAIANAEQGSEQIGDKPSEQTASKPEKPPSPSLPSEGSASLRSAAPAEAVAPGKPLEDPKAPDPPKPQPPAEFDLEHDMPSGLRRAPPPKPADRIWGPLREALGLGDADRSFIGRLIREHGEDAVCAAMARAAEMLPADPKSWLKANVKGGRNGQAEQAQRGDHDSLLARTKALLAERDARLGAGDPDRAADAVLPAVPGGR